MIKRAKKAIILAAGYGTRLRPLTDIMPKPLLSVWGEPMLDRIVKLLLQNGVQKIAVNAHHLAGDISKYAEKNTLCRDIVVSVEDGEVLGTGGALNPLAKFIGKDDFYLINGDIVLDGTHGLFDALDKAFGESGNFASALISSVYPPRTIEADPEGRVTNWKAIDPGIDGTYTYCGLARLSPQILIYVKPSGFSTIVEAYEKAAQDNLFVRGVELPEIYWNDCGTMERYLETHAALKPGEFEENPNVVFPGVKFLDNADIAGCVVTGGLVGGRFERQIIAGVSQLATVDLKPLCEALGWKASDSAAIALGARGSNRSFFRLINGDERAIAIIYDDSARPENARYAGHAKLLSSAGVPVPRVLADIPSSKILALEDLGDDSLQSRYARHEGSTCGTDHCSCCDDDKEETPSQKYDDYEKAVKALAQLHVKATERALEEDTVLEPSFSPDLYKWERDLFADKAVKNRFGFDALPDDVAADFETVEKQLLSARPVLVHRDFQSSNLIFRKESGELCIIDFQGMRLGPAAYDLASLLYDPYVDLCEKSRKKLAKAYLRFAPDLTDAVSLLPYAAVQRLAQCVGAYGRLEEAGHKNFAVYVMPALQRLLEAADEAGLDAIGGFAEELIRREEIREKNG